MVLSFLQAKERVCPDSFVVPGSKEHKDILELMRQSGRIFPEENTTPVVPKPVTHILDLLPYREREFKPVLESVSKRKWLSIDINKAAMPVYKEEPYVAPEPIPWAGKTAEYVAGMSKREWVSKLK